MLYKNIPAAQTKLFSKLVLDYINGDEFVKSFYKYRPVMASFEEVIANKKFDETQRLILADELLNQYAQAGISPQSAPKVFNHIEKLKDRNTFTVTTGHQLALFTGPLFFVYKIITTLRLAEELQLNHPDKHFVPVFWMASEDHDFEEINHVFAKGQKLSWNKQTLNQPVGRLTTEGLADVMGELRALLGGDSYLIQLFENCYTGTNTLSDATIRLVHALFGEQGLVILEPDNKRLKQQFTQVMREDILNQSSFDALIQTNGKLDRKYKLQITGREVNFFYLSDKGRNLIFKTTKGYEVQHTDIVLTPAQMEQEIAQFPERFSPNVVLRPVYQEHILPNIAYVGGPGEAAYWLQLKDVFGAHSVPYPMVVLRNSVFLLKQSSIHKIEKRKVMVEQLFEKVDLMIKDYLSREHPVSLMSYAESLDALLQRAIDEIMPFDNRLASRIIHLKGKTLDDFSKLQKDLIKSKKLKSENDIQVLTAIRNELFPNDQPQERYDTLISYASNYPQTLIQNIGKALLPLSHTVDVMIWD